MIYELTFFSYFRILGSGVNYFRGRKDDRTCFSGLIMIQWIREFTSKVNVCNQGYTLVDLFREW